MGRASPIRTQPLWVRVDENRFKLAAFVVLFVFGSALLLATALVLVPGVLIGVLIEDFESYAVALGWWYAAAVLVLLALGSVAAAVQLGNAESWVRARFQGRDLAPGEAGGFERAVGDVAIAAGLSAPPRLVLMEVDSVNAFALGTTRSRPAIGVTRGLLASMTEAEQRAVAATLVARVVAGDIMFATALAALMGPLKAVRESKKLVGSGAGCAADGCVDSGCSGCGDADGCLSSLDGEGAGGCLGAIGVAVFIAVVIAITYAAVLTAAWIVTLWGRALHRTTYEKADAEGMLLLKDPGPMLSALRKAITSSTEIGDGDASYDGIFYAATSGKPSIEKVERRRFRRLAEVLGVDGAKADAELGED